MNTAVERYPFRESEAKWQRIWAEQNTFACAPNNKPKYYVLEMFPYPSGHIHMGHVRNYTLGDVLARYKKACGFNVMHPMGWDAFGLPAENAAIQNNTHPGSWTKSNIDTMRGQLQSIGLSYDWAREVATCDADYYQHEQRFFLRMLKSGLAYRKESWVNWDPVDHTVLANEQVIEGRGWRSGALVERKKLSQWFLKITEFADDLLGSLATLTDWPDKVKLMQEKWIGKSYGASLHFEIQGRADKLEVYTTRPDTLFGMSFAAIAAQHPLALELAEKDAKVAAFIQECGQLGTSEEAIEKAEKKGHDTGLKLVHPFTGETKPLYIANFVLMDYGTGAIFGCPGHDQRDFDFARKYKLSITPVVAPKDADPKSFALGDAPFIEDGVMINSDFLNGLGVEEAKLRAIAELEKKKQGTQKINFRLRDWGISRQRYWGCPIPIIHCAECGPVPVPEDQLPVTLPVDVSFDKPGNPLAHHPTWKHVNCPTCNKSAQRETDTFDTFFESSWYFARYCDVAAPEGINAEAVSYWMPVDKYIGGVEHAVLHLLYSRFFMRALQHCGYKVPKEPFTGLMTQGMICHQTYQAEDGTWLYPDDVVKNDSGAWVNEKTGKPVTIGRSEKMSKSKKNTVDPRHIIESYGADTARLFMLSDSPPDRDLEWTEAGIDGAWRYINRLWRLVMENRDVIMAGEKLPLPASPSDAQLALLKQVHKTMDAVSRDIEAFHYNKAVARIRELTNAMESFKLTDDGDKALFAFAITQVIHLFAPMLPHLMEEIWRELGHKDMVCERPWPKADAAYLVDDTVTVAVQVNGKLRATLQLMRDADKELAEREALAQASVITAIEGKQVKKIIVVPNKIVNVVAA